MNFAVINIIKIAINQFLVQPAAKEDGWDTEPFVLTPSADGSKLYGRGSTDDKGPGKQYKYVIPLCYNDNPKTCFSFHYQFLTLKFSLVGGSGLLVILFDKEKDERICQL